MHGERASSTKHARIHETIYRIFEHGKSFIPNFVAFFVFSGGASSCIFKIVFVWLMHYSLGRGVNNCSLLFNKL